MKIIFNNIQIFIKNFIENKGLWVMSSLISVKFILLINSIFVIRIIPKAEFGVITYYLTINNLLIGIVGLGAYQGLMRFGSLLEDTKKNILSIYAFQKGIQLQLIINFIFILCFLLGNFSPYLKYWIIPTLSVRLFFYFIFNQIQIDFRIRHKNKQFSQVTILFSVFSLILSLIFTYFFSWKGYLISLALAPIISLLFVKKDIFYEFISNREVSKIISLKSFWKYSIYSCLTLIINDLLLSFDMILAGFYFSETNIAEYKVAIIIPFNFIFIPQIFLQTDFINLCKNFRNKEYIINYIKNFTLIFSFLGFFIAILGYYFKDLLISFLFGEKYENGNLFFIFLITVILLWNTRVLFTNLISAIGKVYWNSIIAIFSLLILLILISILIPKFHILGLVYSFCFTLIFSGILSTIIFFYLFKKQS